MKAGAAKKAVDALFLAAGSGGVISGASMTIMGVLAATTRKMPKESAFFMFCGVTTFVAGTIVIKAATQKMN